MEKLEFDTTAAEHLVKGHKNDVSHAGAQLPGERTSMTEEHAEEPAQPLPGRQRRPGGIASFIRKSKIVEPLHEGRLH